MWSILSHKTNKRRDINPYKQVMMIYCYIRTLREADDGKFPEISLMRALLYVTTGLSPSADNFLPVISEAECD